MVLKIYKPTKTAMQSGRGKTKKWIAEYVSDKPIEKDTLMGWNSSKDTKSQIKIFFDSKDKAISWAKKNNFQFEVLTPQIKKIIPKNYADNFSYKRKEPWTH